MSHKLNLRRSPVNHPLVVAARCLRGTLHPLPAEVFLSGWFPGVRNQGDEGSCSGFGTAGFREVLHGSATKQAIPERLSPAYLYGKTRQAEGTFPEDSGCTVADELAVLHAWGVCREELLPYSDLPTEAPTPDCDADAKLFRVGQPLMVQLTKQAFMSVLAAGMPIVIGMPVGQSFMNVGADGKVPFPPNGEAPEGGHCTFLLGYNAWGVMGANSWGTSWGDRGFYYLPWGYEELIWEAWSCPLVA